MAKKVLKIAPKPPDSDKDITAAQVNQRNDTRLDVVGGTLQNQQQQKMTPNFCHLWKFSGSLGLFEGIGIF